MRGDLFIEIEHLLADINDGHLSAESREQRTVPPTAGSQTEHPKAFEVCRKPATFVENQPRVFEIVVRRWCSMSFPMPDTFVPNGAIMFVRVQAR
jgi:hypothetical protein